MTYSELKDELYLVRERERVIRSKQKDLESLKDDYLTRLPNGVTDYSKDRLQSTPDPDRALVNLIDDINRDTQKLIEIITELREANEYYKTLILNMTTVGGEVLRLFFVEGYSMRQVAKRLNYAERSTWRLWREAIKDMTEVINNEKV